MEMYSLLDKLYGGLDVQDGWLFLISETQGPLLSFRKSDVLVWAI